MTAVALALAVGTVCLFIGLVVGVLAGYGHARRQCAARHHRHDRLSLRHLRR